MEQQKKVTLAVFILYMLFMIAVGLFFSRKKIKTQKEYSLGNRSLNPWVTALSAQASDMSGWLLMGLPGLVYFSTGQAKKAIFIAIGLLIGTILNWSLLAKRFRVYTEVANDAITVPQYFIRRFHDDKKIMGLVSGIIILIFFTVYTSAMFAGGAKVLNIVFGVSYRNALFLGAGIIVLYTFLGGFQAVSWTDLFQGIIMFLAIIVVPLFILFTLDSTQKPELGNYIVNSLGSEYSFANAISDLGWGLGYFGMPHIITRFMAIKDKKLVKPARIIALIWVGISLSAAIFVGFVGHIALKGVNIDQENIFIVIVQKKIPSLFIGAVLLTGILAAIMSTADSQLLVASTAFSADIYKQHIRKKSSEREVLATNKVALILVAFVAIGIASNPNSSVFEIVEYAWAGFGASFGPVILFSVYFSKITKTAAISSMLTGALSTIIFRYGINKIPSNPFIVYELIPAT